MRTTVVEVTCDFCGYGGPLTRPDDFEVVNGVDLCRWCANPKKSTATETGRHLVTFAGDDAWSCSCGRTWRRPLILTVVERAVPRLANATAHVHMETGR